MLTNDIRDDIDSDEGCARETHYRFGNDDSIEDWLRDNERLGA